LTSFEDCAPGGFLADMVGLEREDHGQVQESNQWHISTRRKRGSTWAPFSSVCDTAAVGDAVKVLCHPCTVKSSKESSLAFRARIKNKQRSGLQIAADQ
jgi:hypothetical protein